MQKAKPYQPDLFETVVVKMVHTKENNRESEKILHDNYEKLNKQCKKVLDALKAGNKLTVRDAMIEMGIGHLPRRIKDLRENGYDVKSDVQPGGFKIYYL